MTDMVQLKVRVTAETETWVRDEAERRGVSASAFVRAALDYYREALPQGAPTGVKVLDEAIAAFDRATMTT